MPGQHPLSISHPEALRNLHGICDGAKVKTATIQDVPAIVEMGRRFHAKSGMEMPFDPEGAAAFVGNVIQSPSGVIFLTDGGMIGGVLTPAYCAPQWLMAVELAWWAEDRAGLRLLAAFEEWAADNGASEIRMTTICGLTAAETILSRKGYFPREISHVKVI